MNTFNEGDRVSHPTYGEGYVSNPYGGASWLTVQFDSGDLVMTDRSLLTPVPPVGIRVPHAARFKAGDQVHHSNHGSATVIAVDKALKLVTIQPTFYRDGKTVQVHPISLTLATEGGKFKVGDRVSHPLHRDGTVEDIQANGVHVVNIGGTRVYMALEHQIEPAKPVQKFNVVVTFAPSGGFATGGLNSGPMVKAHAESYLTQLPDWDNVESITINRVKG